MKPRHFDVLAWAIANVLAAMTDGDPMPAVGYVPSWVRR